MKGLLAGLLFGVATILQMPASAAEPNPAPAFTLNDNAGNRIELPRRGPGVGADIYLFWATWCPYCKALMPHLQSILDEYGDQVRVYALNIREDGEPAEYLASQGYDFILLPEADAVAEQYGAKSTPGIFIVDGNGLIQFNLYQLLGADSAEYQKLNNRQKAARRGPWWASHIRQRLDHILEK